MNKYVIRILILTAMLLFIGGTSCAEMLVSVSDTSAAILPTSIDGQSWYFLPAFAGDELTLNGTAFSLNDLNYDEENACWQGQVNNEEIHVMRGGLRSMFLFSDDPVNKGRSWIEDCNLHENETTGRMILYSREGTADFSENLLQLRGRGNSTWRVSKRPYQIKLENKQDLLMSGIEDEKNRKWVLLADYYDSSLLNNRIGLDMARALGLTETSRCENIDLYYDGEYLGVYALCEKVEVGNGRIQLTGDQEKQSAKRLKVAGGFNAYGLQLQYYEGVREPDDPAEISYLTELESDSTIDGSSCWFTLSSGVKMSVKSPEYLGYESMCYISEKTEDLWLTAQNGGVHPETGATLAMQMDLDSFARALLVYDYLYCHDGLSYSSAFFKLEAGSSVFTSGPLWDFDLGARYQTNGANAGGFGMHRTERKEWFSALISVPEMQRTMLTIWQEQMSGMVEEFLKKRIDQENAVLKRLSTYNRMVEASRRMNVKLYGMLDSVLEKYGASIEQNAELQRQFFTDRKSWMDVSLGHMYTDEVDTVCLTATTDYTDAEGSFSLEVMKCFNAEVSDVSTSLWREADESDYAIYEVNATIRPLSGSAFAENVSLYVNGIQVQYETDENGEISFSFSFEDAGYRYLESDGQDIGLVLDLDWLRENRPDLSACYPTDEELLNWFTTEGMENGEQGNAYFSPRLLRTVCIDWGLEGDFCYDYQSYLDWGQYEWDFTAYEEELSLRYAPVILLPWPL